ncbi:hypothetical protein PPERSA_06193 [Pseudocohnilembus persalinus]|uniref:Uncharacterized protein n=1 Tax=Pseudocohnilembus persalinus TaxID=266149 RepID=A0A0V0R0C8_PSEPJ|nr:hypothetical protein PPERSA_06193 [Pseudocohnilembus persalinus]|eukprot:KRX08015.1 hypothetical protein PPERSA_06193 [Pseudocohnilembus persalinus]
MGDGCDSNGMKGFMSYLQNSLGQQVYIKCIESGEFLQGLYTTLNYQSEKACQIINEDENFKGKTISVLGLSKGGLIARYITQKCEFGGKVARYVSVGTPQLGVARIPFWIENLEVMMLAKFQQDEIVTPPETAWFYYYDHAEKITPLTKQVVYNSLGLKKLMENDKIYFVSLPRYHLDINKQIIDQYFAKALKGENIERNSEGIIEYKNGEGEKIPFKINPYN